MEQKKTNNNSLKMMSVLPKKKMIPVQFKPHLCFTESSTLVRASVIMSIVQSLTSSCTPQV